MISQILGEFDFYKVQRVMELLNWTWTSSQSETGVPEVHELVACANELLKRLEEAPEIQATGTGGFYAYWFKDDMNNDRLGLRFVLEESEC